MTEFSLNEKGVWFNQAPNKKGEQPEPIWVCSPLKVIAVIRDHNNENFGRLLQFSDSDDVIRKWPMPMELLAGDSLRKYCKQDTLLMVQLHQWLMNKILNH